MYGRSGRAPLIVREFAYLILAMSFMAPRTASSQTPSPLQEWQYSGGIILARLFEPNLPDWRIVLGAAAEVQPVYDGSRAYRLQGGPVINIQYRDIAFVTTGEGIGVNFLRGDHYRVGAAVSYDFGRRVRDDYTGAGLVLLAWMLLRKMISPPSAFGLVSVFRLSVGSVSQ